MNFISIANSRMVAVMAILCMPLLAKAEDRPGFFREAGAWLSIARASYGGQFIDGSPADRLPILGFAAGAFSRLELLRTSGIGIGLQPELNYVPRGANVELDGVYLGNFRAKYLEIPFLGRIEPPAIGPVSFYAVAGPSLSVLLSAKSGNINGDTADAEDIARLDIALAVGLGISTAVTRRIAVSLETRYIHGFRTVDDTGETEILNRAIMFSLGASVRFGKDELASLEE